MRHNFNFVPSNPQPTDQRRQTRIVEAEATIAGASTNANYWGG